MKYIGATAFLLISMQCQASIISGMHITSGGKEVDLGGLQWLSLDDTAGYTRTAIESGSAGDWLFKGWRYSTRQETEALLDSLWGGEIEGFHQSNYDGADWFLSNFQALYSEDDFSQASTIADNFSYSRFVFGATDTTDINSHLGQVEAFTNHTRRPGHFTNSYLLGNSGSFYDNLGLSFGANADSNGNYGIGDDVREVYMGHMLVRAIAVPEPPGFLLFIFGVMGLMFSRIKMAPESNYH